MAPRTRDQQDAYNEKRRKENASKSAYGKTKAASARAKAAPKKASATVVAAVVKVPVIANRAARRKAKSRADEVALSLKAKAASDARDKPKLTKVVHLDDADQPLPPVKEPALVQESVPSGPHHTMARSYLRSGAPGLGKLRGKTYQATVSFTEAQMPQLVEAAKFRGVSLAEMIRSCVVEHLNKG